MILREIMALPKQKFREIVLQLLYCNEHICAKKEDVFSFFMKQIKVSKKNVKEASDYKDKIIEKLPQIDEKIKAISTEYSFDRISLVELNIIRLSLYEIFFDESIPKKVSIAEAIRLCRKFATPHSANFVNAIIDQHKNYGNN